MSTVEDERVWLERADHQASQDFDRSVMTLASGGLAISIVFVNDVAPNPTHTAWLVSAWALLALSLLTVLMSFLASQVALRAEMRRIDDELDRTRPTSATRVTRLLTGVAPILLILGVASLLVFSSANL